MSLTVTLHAWWALVYLAIGAALWLPMEWWIWRHLVEPKSPFWRDLRRSVRRRPYVPFAVIVAWPVAVWEEFG